MGEEQKEMSEQEQKRQKRQEREQKLSEAVQKMSNKMGKNNKLGGAIAKKMAPLLIKGAIILAIVILVIVLICVVLGTVTGVKNWLSKQFDFTKGAISSPYGITGETMYGARTIYEDVEQANLDIEASYGEFVCNILIDAKNSPNLYISATLDTATAYAENEFVTLVVNSIANEITKPADATGYTNLPTQECIAKLENFGWTEDQKNTALEVIADDLVENGYNKIGENESTAQQIVDELTTIYSTNYSYMGNIAPKVYVKDYIPAGDETIQNITQEKYYGFVFMPKQNCEIKESSFTIITTGSNTATATLKLMSQGTASVVSQEQTVDNSWYDSQNQMPDKFYESGKINKNISTFTAIDTNDTGYLSAGKSIFELLRQNKFETYFKATTDYSGNNLLENIKSNDYLYLQISTQQGIFIAEYETKLK
ncbi:MAG: hypothetical protein E7378_02350 [Clostridiales bacterium]|nr:hypothetical protein [Clostridiales bacterium]